MKILFVLDRYSSSSGGADRLARGAVQALLQNGHSVQVIQDSEAPSTVESDRFKIVSYAVQAKMWIRDGEYLTLRCNRVWRSILERVIREDSPDLILCQNRLVPAAVGAGLEAGIRTVILFHGYRCLSPTFFFQQDALTAPAFSFGNAPFRYKLKWPLVRCCLDLYARAYQQADCVIANSQYASNVLQRFYECRCEVVYPVVDMSALSSQPPLLSPNVQSGKKVLFVKPQRIKGLGVFLAVAGLRQDLSFLVVGQAPKRLQHRFSGMKNVEYLCWTDDMESVYSRTSVLFGPSQIPEPFGRVFLEAGLRGIPSLASNAGGIPESVGEGGILLPQNALPSDWADALEQMLDGPNYLPLCHQAHRHAHHMLDIHTAERLAERIVAPEPC